MSKVSDRLRRMIHLPGALSAMTDRLPQLLHQSRINNELVGRLLANQTKSLGPRRELREAEFRVYSQFGDDGIIQYLIHNVPFRSDSFIEFGVEDYSEANTRFLLVNDNWRGLVMDGSSMHMEQVRQRDISWQHDLTAVDAFVTKENINGVIEKAGFAGELGILSIDIDGNDYWIWEALTVVDPAIVVVEYNSVFGRRRAVSVPYAPDFRRAKAHSSHLFWGCSSRALCLLAERKGYVFVGCNSNGNNAYFVKRKLAQNVIAKTAEAGYVASRIRESRGSDGALTYKTGTARFDVIADMQVMDVERGVLARLGDVPDV